MTISTLCCSLLLHCLSVVPLGSEVYNGKELIASVGDEVLLVCKADIKQPAAPSWFKKPNQDIYDGVLEHFTVDYEESFSSNRMNASAGDFTLVLKSAKSK
jgi:hypothetical protein